MKIAFSHLKKYFIEDIDINTISNSLFQLGHENEIDNDILDIEFTPNKGDCLSVFGIARDLKSIHEVDLSLGIYEKEINELSFNFENKAPLFCPNITFLKIEIDKPTNNYKPYLEDYFKKLNLNKNNFFTDISNYLGYEIGQPTHCYDYNSVKDGITLNKTNERSHFKTLLEKEIELSPGENVFLKDGNVINLAGIMGGEDTKCSKSSTKALVECAFFNPDMIIGKATKYDLFSDAAYKFERGVDIDNHSFALRRFIKIVQDHANIKSVSLKSFPEYKHHSKQIESDHNKINKILGSSLDREEINNILERLGFGISKKFIVPSWRRDIDTINDLAEEVARVVGFDNIETTKFEIFDRSSTKTINSKSNRIREFMLSNGFNEVINDPFVGEKFSTSVKIDNPLDSNRQFLRLNIINSLLANLDYNEKRQKESIKLFEISDIYEKNKQINSKRLFSLIVSGRQGLNHIEFNKSLDKSYLINLISQLGLDMSYIKELNRDLINTKIKNKIYYVECQISDIDEDMLQYNNKIKKFNFTNYEPISEFPTSYRDLSISILKKDIIEEAFNKIFTADIKNLKHLFLFDFYENKDKNILKAGFRFVFQSNKRTLLENEIDFEMQNIFKKLLAIEGLEIPGLQN